MPTPRDQRRRSRRDIKPDRVRALESLAGCGEEGCTKAGKRLGDYGDRRACAWRLATATAEHEVAGGREHEIARVQITDAGRQVLERVRQCEPQGD
jgi:hypothetical protein